MEIYSFDTSILHKGVNVNIFLIFFIKKIFKKNIDKKKNLCYNERREKNSSCAWRFNSASPQVRE